MKNFIILTFLSFVVSFSLLFYFIKPETSTPQSNWRIKSVDTMKQSRDIARQTLTNRSHQKSIDRQVKQVAQTGATHVAVGTPYDEEFIPVLKMWVDSARKHNLKVFFRGNFSGWEKWFGYEKINREAHTQKTKEFIRNNASLFMDGDLFSSCPECENGETLDRSNKQQINEYKQFLINEYNITKATFKEINKDVLSNNYSMNGDMAFLMMDRQTVQSFDGVVSIDHYVKTPQKLEEDIKKLVDKTGARIVLGEFGAPIPDIHGKMTSQEQNIWINDALNRVSKIPEVDGINYWVNMGGSTAIYKDDGTPKPAVETIKQYFKDN